MSMPLYERWLTIAKSDFRILIIMLERNDERVFDVTIFHSQQCAEKALKAFLVLHRQPIDYTHNPVKLINACAELDERFASLTPYAARVACYADEDGFSVNNFEHKTTRDELEMAILSAQEILNFVIKKISESTI